ncbi:MAG: hypothetical protein IKW04_00905 [Clostridia bacterium]|nr:hypothetical protein [Clostridia bacterium]
MKAKKNATKIISIIALIIIILTTTGLIIMNTIRKSHVEITETYFHFGQEFSNKVVELSGNDIPNKMLPLDENGDLILTDIAPGEYQWKIIGTDKSGTATISDEIQSKAKPNLQEQWNQLWTTLQNEYSIDVILLCIGVVAFLVLLHVLFFIIRKGGKKSFGKSENYCPSCGFPFSNIGNQKMKCPVCNSEIPIGSHFCANCGAPFANPADIQTQPPTQNKLVNNQSNPTNR